MSIPSERELDGYKRYAYAAIDDTVICDKDAYLKKLGHFLLNALDTIADRDRQIEALELKLNRPFPMMGAVKEPEVVIKQKYLHEVDCIYNENCDCGLKEHTNEDD